MDNDTPTELRRIDLDAAAEARAATRGEPVSVTFRGDTYILPPELPAAFLEEIGADHITNGMIELLGDEQGTQFMSHRPSMEDLMFFAEEIAILYGLPGGLGKSLASGGQSSKTSKR